MCRSHRCITSPIAGKISQECEHIVDGGEAYFVYDAVFQAERPGDGPRDLIPGRQTGFYSAVMINHF